MISFPEYMSSGRGAGAFSSLFGAGQESSIGRVQGREEFLNAVAAGKVVFVEFFVALAEV